MQIDRLTYRLMINTANIMYKDYTAKYFDNVTQLIIHIYEGPANSFVTNGIPLGIF